LNRDFREMLCAFDAEGVEYLLIGAFAVLVHGHSRATGDMDLLVRPSPENARRVMAALRRFGAPVFQVKEEDFAVPGTVFQIGVPPLRIDILTSIVAVDFDEAFRRRFIGRVEDLAIPVLGREDLIRNKRAAGRPKDRLDADWLERNRPPGDTPPRPRTPRARRRRK
jgi:hypothetical protein